MFIGHRFGIDSGNVKSHMENGKCFSFTVSRFTDSTAISKRSPLRPQPLAYARCVAPISREDLGEMMAAKSD